MTFNGNANLGDIFLALLDQRRLTMVNPSMTKKQAQELPCAFAHLDRTLFFAFPYAFFSKVPSSPSTFLKFQLLSTRLMFFSWFVCRRRLNKHPGLRDVRKRKKESDRHVGVRAFALYEERKSDRWTRGFVGHPWVI